MVSYYHKKNPKATNVPKPKEKELFL